MDVNQWVGNTEMIDWSYGTDSMATGYHTTLNGIVPQLDDLSQKATVPSSTNVEVPNTDSMTASKQPGAEKPSSRTLRASERMTKNHRTSAQHDSSSYCPPSDEDEADDEASDQRSSLDHRPKKPCTLRGPEDRKQSRTKSEQDDRKVRKLNRIYNVHLTRAKGLGVDLEEHELVEVPTKKRGPWRERKIRQLEEGINELKQMIHDHHQGEQVLQAAGQIVPFPNATFGNTAAPSNNMPDPNTISVDKQVPWWESKPMEEWDQEQIEEWANSLEDPVISDRSAPQMKAPPPARAAAQRNQVQVTADGQPTSVDLPTSATGASFGATSDLPVAYKNNGPSGAYVTSADGNLLGHITEGAFGPAVYYAGTAVAYVNNGPTGQVLSNAQGKRIGYYRNGPGGVAFYYDLFSKSDVEHMSFSGLSGGTGANPNGMGNAAENQLRLSQRTVDSTPKDPKSTQVPEPSQYHHSAATQSEIPKDLFESFLSDPAAARDAVGDNVQDQQASGHLHEDPIAQYIRDITPVTELMDGMYEQPSRKAVPADNTTVSLDDARAQPDIPPTAEGVDAVEHQGLDGQAVLPGNTAKAADSAPPQATSFSNDFRTATNLSPGA
ncbi:Hypothetical predicted protein [Lecanosticta acicola]|uniref:Uncharacterized protein n=1 Tax=Lecanosticta acicola TaxID=111012 RepID=A0AAI8Z9F5_9PEZI|nr:Hypothetical predicted protein [Lecanosticta acicola]